MVLASDQAPTRKKSRLAERLFVDHVPCLARPQQSSRKAFPDKGLVCLTIADIAGPGGIKLGSVLGPLDGRLAEIWE